MRTVLFCNLPYAFSIFKPLSDALLMQKIPYVWYMPPSLHSLFPYDGDVITDINELEAYQSDAIFVCGNDVPFWLRGVKVQIFHGLAGEKKGHFRIRDYFDLYLTQGPYFTERFQRLAQKHKNFEVTETGWCKLDPLFHIPSSIIKEKEKLLKRYGAKHLVLYAPTFSPSLTSAPEIVETIRRISQRDDTLVIIKFHDKMKPEWKALYYNLSSRVLIKDESDITPLLQMADLMISDTSSVVYEFLLLDKPVITYKNISTNIAWHNVTNPTSLYQTTKETLKGNDPFSQKRQEVIAQYHPYQDGLSSYRMISATQAYIDAYGVPKKRALPLYRKYKLYKKYNMPWTKLFTSFIL